MQNNASLAYVIIFMELVAATATHILETVF